MLTPAQINRVQPCLPSDPGPALQYYVVSQIPRPIYISSFHPPAFLLKTVSH